jgi:hypothetical protein
MTRKEELQKRIDDARTELFKITDAEKYENNIKLLNKCYKFRNSYSCPHNEEDYWWMYQKITSINEYGNLKSFTFQTDKDGKIEIEQNYEFCESEKIEIDYKEFVDEWNYLLVKLIGIKN